MLLRLEAIKFNHDTSSATVDAFNIRKNEAEFIEPPEWRRGLSINPEDSPAAYALCETRGNTLTIEANFSCDDLSVTALEIRAVDGRICLIPHNNTNGNILGEVALTTVEFADGKASDQRFELTNVRIWDAGVGKQDILWHWQYRRPGTAAWSDFATTTHRIYTVLQLPNPPWLRNPHVPSNTNLPWVEVLSFACDWASGTQNTDDAAALVTERLNDLGSTKVLDYESSEHYTDDLNFDCRGFLEDLRGTDFPVRVNCDDCAAIVSAFSNILGCSLSQMYIEPVNAAEIGLKPIIRIGSHTWLEEDDFDHHEVASEGACGELDEIFDACVQVANVDEPNPTNRIPLQPTNLRFGLLGEEGYRSRLVTSDHQALCRPHPAGCTQRQLHAANRLGVPDEQQLNILKQRHGFDNASRENLKQSGSSILTLHPHVLPQWRLLRLRKFDKGEVEAEEPQASQSHWQSMSNPQNVIRIDVFECASSSDARNGILTLLTRFEQRGMKPVEPPKFGDVVFTNERSQTILFSSNNLIFFLRNVGRETLKLVEVAESLNRAVIVSAF